MNSEEFDRIAADADARVETYEQFGMHRSAAAALNTADKARAAATRSAAKPTAAEVMLNLMAAAAPAELPAASQSTSEHAVTVLLTEYDKLKSEQLARVGTRDNLLYAQLASTAAVIAAVASARIPALLLLLPVASTVLGWTYITNDYKVSAIGAYIRQNLDPRLGALMGQQGPLFGWEQANRADRRRVSRKWVHLLVDLVAFTAPALTALAVVVAAGPRTALLITASVAELAMVALLAAQIVIYADLRRRPTSR